MINLLPMSTDKQMEIATETNNDPTLCKLTNFIRAGWPDTRKQVDPTCRPFWDFREELTIEKDCIFRDYRVVIPKSLQNEMITRVHAHSHQGIEKTKNLARDVMFWPSMNAHIEDRVSKCETCNAYKQQNARQPMTKHEKPARRWEKVGTDLFEWEEKSYLLIVDYYSSFFEINALPNIRSNTVINYCKEHFARHGIPSVVISDNAMQYSSAEFARFSQEYNFKHTKSSPHYPQSNGKAEKRCKLPKPC
jgi:hypothetical protein